MLCTKSVLNIDYLFEVSLTDLPLIQTQNRNAEIGKILAADGQAESE
jgi:hypothetical protein